MIYTVENFKSRYENYINGEWVSPVSGNYFNNISPINGQEFCEIPRSDYQDVERALDAATIAFKTWGKTSATERANILNKIADRLEENLERFATIETYDNGKPIRETLAADIPLAVDHFRYFASAIRVQESGMSELDIDTVSYHLNEPIGVVGQIIPWNFPLLMAAWKVAPALAAGNTVVLKPAEQTPLSILCFMELVGDLLPPGVLNVVNGFGIDAGKPLAASNRVGKIAFTGETATGKLIMQYASENIIPVTLELGGKSPNIFTSDVMDEDDGYRQKALEGFAMFALNQGEVCTCPSRALIDDKIFDEFLGLAVERTAKIKQGNPLDINTMIGAQVSKEQMDKINSYLDIGRQEGAEILLGGEPAFIGPEFEGGYYIQPTVFKGQNNMRVFREEIFGPVVSVTNFNNLNEALEIANDTAYGLGAGVWSRSQANIRTASRQLQAGRVWVNCYHLYPAHAAFGGYKQSGIGRETHKMMLSHYQKTKNILESHTKEPMGFF